MNNNITLLDLVGAIILIALLFFFANFYKLSKIKENPEYKYFTIALFTKTFGAIVLVFVYEFYYGEGDTHYYFYGGRETINTLFTDPVIFFKLLFSKHANFSQDLQLFTKNILYSNSPEEWFMVKIISVFNLFSFNRFIISSIFVSLFSFYGGWKLFKTFLYFFPNEKKVAFISVFLIPDVIFWGSGILKDTITLASLSIFFYHFVNIFYKQKISVKAILIMIITFYIVFKLKAYIIFGFMPAILISLYANYKNRIKNKFFRQTFGPQIFVVFVIFGYFMLLDIAEKSEKYKLENLQSRVEGFHSWHTTTGGSSYNLGDVEYTPIGILSKLPLALNATFFRPYIWDAKNITSLLGAIESTIFILLFLFVLWKYKLKWIVESFNNDLLLIALIFSIVFGFAVGFTSYNFGALARYKIPVMPFFSFLLLHFYFKYKEKIKKEI